MSQPTWAALFERAPDGVTLAEVRAALRERRAADGEAGGGSGDESGSGARADPESERENGGREGNE
jgi:hypothetical protein